MEEMTITKSIFEQLGGTYEQQGDYLLPCLTVPAENEQPIGVWGQRHLRYLKEYRRATYITLLTSGRLNAYLADIVFCQVLFPEKSVGIPFFQQGIFPAFSGHYASLRMRACSIR